jgi:predicted metal-dependent hydrolase
MRPQEDEIQYGDTAIRYTIARSAERETVAVTVHPNGAVTAIVPKGMRRVPLAAAVAKKADWIIRQQEFFRRQSVVYPKQYVSGESFLYLGRQYKLKVRRSIKFASVAVQFAQGQFIVEIPGGTEKAQQPEAVRTALERWYRRRASELVPPLVSRYAAKLGVNTTTVHIREMRKRWGSHAGNGTLFFNWRIVMAPKRLIEYVVAHELCHLVYNDHSREFWRLLERALPGCERRRMELELAGPRFDLNSAEAST